MSCTFNSDWMDTSLNPQFLWVRPVKDSSQKAMCSLCKKTFSLSNMGRQALISHMDSDKHKKYEKSNLTNIDSFFKRVSVPTPNHQSTAPVSTTKEQNAQNKKEQNSSKILSEVNSPNGNQIMSAYVRKDDVLKSEILWALKVIDSHFSYNSSKNIKELLKLMFPDSKIADKMTLGSTKLSYLITHGLAPYFHDELMKLIDSPYVLCFDEAFNEISKKGQMDLVIRFWDSSVNQVTSRYLSSSFMGHSTAQDILEHFLEASNELKLCNLIQISMDGPNVNWSFLEKISAYLKLNRNSTMLCLGSCGLHVINGALQTGHKASKWNVQALLKSIYKLFKDSPARRADYTALTESDIFPKKFCAVRWAENVEVCERALQVFQNIQLYISKSKKLPATYTVKIVKEACNDPLTEAKISFFCSVASILEPFLRRFQTDAPMAPFLYSEIYCVLQVLMRRFIKRDVMDKATTPKKLNEIDINSPENVCDPKDVDIGTQAKSYLRKANITGKEKQNFQKECLEFLIATVSKIHERSPLKYKITRPISCIVPGSIINSRTVAENKMKVLVEILFETNWISAVVADKAKAQFSQLCFKASNEWHESFDNFDWNNDRLDVFYFNRIASREEFQQLWKVLKLVFILSHGNARVESGFSVNRDMLVENLKEVSLVAQRQVYDAIKAKGGILNVNITSEMLTYAKQSHTRYQECLKQAKEKIRAKEMQAKERKRVAEQIKV